MNNYPRIVIAGTESGVGKTTLTLGLLLALMNRELDVQPFKCGPDYIDAGLHSRISKRPCRNLDSFLLSKNVVLELFERKAREASFSVIEGVMGVFDGLGADTDTGSTSHVAKILRSPVILIIDAGRMARSAGAMALGFQKYDRGLQIKGFVLNSIGSLYHYEIAKQAIEEKTGLPVLGHMPKDKALSLPERHLGLTPSSELNMRKYLRDLARLIEKSVDIESIIQIGEGAPCLPEFPKTIFKQRCEEKRVTIAIAHDKAFHFYYEDNLDILKSMGAKLIRFSPLKCKSVPASANGIYIGGGFPEVFASELSRNASLMKDISEKSEGGMPIYAECGGLMYLMNSIEDMDGKEFPMTGIFPGTVRMGKGLRMFGYHNIESLSDNILCNRGSKTKGHIFHWSYIDKMKDTANPAFKVYKPWRDNYVGYDGFLTRNTLASYVHIHFASSPLWARNFIKSIEQYKGAKHN